jgi:hypothetical protein
MRYFTEEKFKYFGKSDRDIIAQEFDFLDTIDLNNLINEALDNSYTIYELMDKIEDRYGEQYDKEDFIFNNIDAFEFMNYLRDVYNVTFSEVINYYLER